MRIYVISDLHLSFGVKNKEMDKFGWGNYFEKILKDWNERVEDEDIVLIPGDFSWAMNYNEAKPDIDKIKNLKGKKFLIRGNHDYWWSSYKKVKDLCEGTNILPIQNNSIKYKNIIICGTRLWRIPTSNDREYEDTDINQEDIKIYEREKQRLKLSLEDMKNKYEDGDKVILMLHYPPFDQTFKDSEITEIISQYPVNTVVYGHIHGKKARVKLFLEKNKIPYLLTSCDQVDNKLVDITKYVLKN